MEQHVPGNEVLLGEEQEREKNSRTKQTGRKHRHDEFNTIFEKLRRHHEQSKLSAFSFRVFFSLLFARGAGWSEINAVS